MRKKHHVDRPHHVLHSWSGRQLGVWVRRVCAVPERFVPLNRLLDDSPGTQEAPRLSMHVIILC